MKSTVIALCLTLGLFGGFLMVQAQSQNADEQQILQIERDACTAVLKKDVATISRLTSDDFMGIGYRGTIHTKADSLAGVKYPDNKVDVCTNDTLKIHIYGNAAVAIGTGMRAGSYKGTAYKNRKILWTDTLIKKDGRWQFVASQGTIASDSAK